MIYFASRINMSFILHVYFLLSYILNECLYSVAFSVVYFKGWKGVQNGFV